MTILLILDNAAYGLLKDRVPLGTVVAGVKVGGLTSAKAAELLRSRAIELEKFPITLQSEESTASLTAKQLGVAIQPDLNLLASSQERWIHLKYWRSFLIKKELPLAYTIDSDRLTQSLADIAGPNSLAQDATLQVSDGRLTIVPEKNGRILNSSQIDAAIRSLTLTGKAPSVVLTFDQTPPAITAGTISQVKAEIETAITPLNLTDNNKSYPLEVATILPAIELNSEGPTVSWRLNTDKLKVQLAATIVRQATVKMSPKTIQSNDGNITSAGQDGREVQVDELVRLVNSAIAEKIDTKASPIVIPIKIIPRSEKTIYPDYVAGLFEGLYIDINLTKQRLYIMNGETKTAEYLISSGKRGTPTPVGLFYIKNKIIFAQSRLYPGIWMEKWNALAKTPDGRGYEGYGVHHVPCFDSQCRTREPQTHLGRPVSAGCVRIENAGADWVYDNAPIGTPVNIH